MTKNDASDLYAVSSLLTAAYKLMDNNLIKGFETIKPKKEQ